MSAFLGPIHHWLFRKINLFETLEKNIVTAISEKYDEDKTIEITKNTQREYEEFIPEKPLEELIDESNIHGWLQNKISIAELRQAATIKEIINTFGNEAISIIKDIYKEQATSIGKEVANSGKATNAIELYQELNNYLLEGMPCDNVNNVISSSPEELKWQITQCLHKPYWDHVGMNSDTMYDLRHVWIKSFVENANSDYTHSTDNENGISQHSIF
ncbi:MAG: hypothetical protein GX214_00345 [Clostridiales bacterium]|nr:hypothetical protein [Clostridiales bacterium]